MAKRKKKQEEEVEVDEELEDLEDLDELDDLEEEEPDEVEEDDELEDEDEEDDEEDEDEEDLTDLPIKTLRQRAIAAGLSAGKAKSLKSASGKKKLASYIESHEDEEVEEDEDEEVEEKPKKKGKKGGSRKGQAPPTQELPKGRLGAQDVADAAGTDARAVRVFLRKHTDEFPKDEELGRYSFNKTEVKKIVKAMGKDS